jgi:hypothetical protein
VDRHAGVPVVPAPAPGALAPADRRRPGDSYLTGWDTLAVILLALLLAAVLLYSAV